MEYWGVPVYRSGKEWKNINSTVISDVEVDFDTTVCVTKDFKSLQRAVGSAQLRNINGTVFANIHILENTPSVEDLTPAIAFDVVESVTDIKTREEQITKIKITSVSLNSIKNKDTSIKTIGEL